MVFREFKKKAIFRERGREIEIPYKIIFYNSEPGKLETSVGVSVNWNEMARGGEYCEGVRDLSNRQLNESGFKTHYSFFPKGSDLEHKKSSARQFIYESLRELIYKPKIERLIGD